MRRFRRTSQPARSSPRVDASETHDPGHAVRGATSGAAALDILRKGRFDMMVIDYTMPDLTGFEVLLGRARALYPDLAVVRVVQEAR